MYLKLNRDLKTSTFQVITSHVNCRYLNRHPIQKSHPTSRTVSLFVRNLTGASSNHTCVGCAIDHFGKKKEVPREWYPLINHIYTIRTVHRWLKPLKLVILSYLKMGHPRSLFHLFSVSSTSKHQNNFCNKLMEITRLLL